MTARRYRIAWPTSVGWLAACEPTPREVEMHAVALAAGYNEPRNAALMGHTEAIAAAEVVALYAEAGAEGTRSFLLFRDDVLVGDGDLRRVRDGGAELAFMIAAPATQGQGLGTRFAVMIHAFGFAQLGLCQIYASVLPANTASRRVFEKLGHVIDHSPRARAFADEPDDLVMAIDRATFERTHAAALAELRIAEREA